MAKHKLVVVAVCGIMLL